MHDILKKAVETHALSMDEMIQLIDPEGPVSFEELRAAADNVRRTFVGDSIHLSGLIEFSSFCRNNCCYCGLRRDNQTQDRMRASVDGVIRMAAQAVESFNLKSFVLQSGEDLSFSTADICTIVKSIKALGASVTLSTGEKSLAEYQAYKQAGADRFLLRIETTDEDVYHRHDPGMSFHNRMRCLYHIKKSGLELCTGSLIGLPGQTVESLANDIRLFKTLDADLVGYGPFIPQKGTPLANATPGDFDLTLRVMAVTRLLLPDTNIPATTAMGRFPNGQKIALQSGANVFMPNVTDKELLKTYNLFPGKNVTNIVSGGIQGAFDGIVSEIKLMGRHVGLDKGIRMCGNADRSKVRV